MGVKYGACIALVLLLPIVLVWVCNAYMITTYDDLRSVADHPS